MNTIISNIVFFSFVLTYNLNASDFNNKIDCIILKDENSIICKYSHTRIQKDKVVIFSWFKPNGNISRVRSMVIPAGHGSVYDYRYINGREQGRWIVKIVDSNKSFQTEFIVE
jgi:hypothetical protein